MNRHGGVQRDGRMAVLRRRMRAAREANAALRGEADQLSAMLHAAPVGVALLDDRLRIVRVNAAMNRVAGTQVPPGSDLSVLSPGLAGELEHLCRSVLESGKPVAEHELRNPDASEDCRCWRANVYPVPGRARAVGLILSDCTHARVAQERAREARQVEAVGRLAAGVAHDFNNLLVGIIGGASLALEEVPYSHPVRPNLEAVLRSGERAAELTRQLLAYSGKGRLFRSRVDFGAIVQEKCAEARSRLPHAIRLVVDTEQRLPPLMADSAQIGEMIGALLINAAESIGDRLGTIRVHAGLERLPDHPGRHFVLQVSDTGAGMDGETMSRIFEPFFTTKFAGRGLSLAAVQGIVRSLNGSIEVSSSPGHGSTFVVRLPAREQSAAAAGGKTLAAPTL